MIWCTPGFSAVAPAVAYFLGRAVQRRQETNVANFSSLRRIALGLAVSAGVFSGALPAEAADGTVNLLVLKENGVGTASQAQGYIDRLMTQAAKVNGWATASGKYVTSRTAAEGYLHDVHPSYGFISLGAFLGLRARHKLEVIGKIEVAQSGGRQYHLISGKHTGLAECKGKTLATNHSDDSRFIDKVVSGGSYQLADFELVVTRRPLQTIKKVISGDAECALIDEAQLEAMKRMDDAKEIKAIWASKELPPMVAVAFPDTAAADVKSFKASLGKICAGDGAVACKEAGIESMTAATTKDYASVIKAYDQ